MVEGSENFPLRSTVPPEGPPTAHPLERVAPGGGEGWLCLAAAQEGGGDLAAASQCAVALAHHGVAR